ncbi:MAG: hypothetical protein Q7R81_07090 [Candidatus Peregrinibacteria bacterium]|nr:hypothetical protein [Candidatus Peregrinibacteria bacterium]
MGEQKIPQIADRIEDLNEISEWISSVDLWLVENIDCRFASKAQTEVKNLRKAIRSMRYWQDDIANPYVPYFSYWREIETPEEIQKRKDELENNKRKGAESEYQKWIPTLKARVMLVRTYLRKIQEWKESIRVKTTDAEVRATEYRIYLDEQDVLRDTNGNFYKLNQEQSRDFLSIIRRFLSGKPLKQEDLESLIGHHPKSKQKKYSGNIDKLLYHYTQKMSRGREGKNFKNDWFVRVGERNKYIYQMNAKYLTR